MDKLTEDQVVNYLMKWLSDQGWTIDDFCLGHAKGIDISASKGKEVLFVEAKGAKANNNSPIKKRAYFDSGQIKDHLGKAIVKSLETKIKYPNSMVAIAHPNDPYIFNICDKTLNELKALGVYKFWVADGQVITNMPLLC